MKRNTSKIFPTSPPRGGSGKKLTSIKWGEREREREREGGREGEEKRVDIL